MFVYEHRRARKTDFIICQEQGGNQHVHRVVDQRLRKSLPGKDKSPTSSM